MLSVTPYSYYRSRCSSPFSLICVSSLLSLQCLRLVLFMFCGGVTGTMDPAALMEAVVEEVACPICMTFLKEPVSIDCGHSFCHSCLSGLWEVPGESQNWGYSCPLCRAPIQPRNLRPNWQLANVVEKVRRLGLHPGMGLRADVCEPHREQLKMFCKEDGLIVCEACSQSPEHQAHSVVPMEDVAWDYKVGDGGQPPSPIQFLPCPSLGYL